MMYKGHEGGTLVSLCSNSGRRTVNVQPVCSPAEYTLILPPCCSTMPWATGDRRQATDDRRQATGRCKRVVLGRLLGDGAGGVPVGCR